MKLLLKLSFFTVAVLLTTLSFGGHAHADSYNSSNLIDNSIFVNSNTMSQSAIQSFLNGQGGSLASQSFATQSNGTQSAAWIIYYASQHIGINPQTIMATMQKEESLVTDPSASSTQYNFAMGYGCPDSGSCSDPGFYNQTIDGSWQLRFDYERANGNNGTWTSPDGTVWGSGISYPCSGGSSFYSTGLYSGNNVTFYDGGGAGYTTITLANAATAALYCYTPHVYPGDSSYYYSGSYNFVQSFISWWGSVHNYSYAFVSAINPPSVMQPGQTATATVVLKNTGGITWWNEANAALSWNEDPAGGGSPTPMRLYTTQPTDHNNVFGGGSGWVGQNRMTMLSGKASPGDPATFQFSYTAPTTPGTYTEHFAPTIENVIKMADVGMAFTVTVPSVHTYAFVSATNPPTTMTSGQSATATVVLQNTGNTTWYNEANAGGANKDPAGGGAPTPMRLFTTNPTDHNNPFGGGGGWVGQNRMAMQTASVAPGQNGTFSFNYTAPSTTTTFTDTEGFAPTIENVAKMADDGMQFAVTVQPKYAYQFVSATNPPTTMTPGQTATATVVLKNTGGATWYNEANASGANADPAAGGAPTPMRLFTARPTDYPNPFGGGSGWVGQNRMTMQTASVAPGQNGTFSFSYTAPLAPGNYLEYFAPTIENVIKLPDVGMAFGVAVQ